MLKIKLSEETKFGILFVFSLVLIVLFMLLLNYFIGGNEKTSFVEKEKEKTVIVTQVKENSTPATPPPKTVVNSVRDALKKGNYSTAYIEINKVSKSSPEYEELRNQLAEETQKRKAPGVRKEKDASPSAPVRYFDESTPRKRSSDAIYVYFSEISGALWPRLCIQSFGKRPLGITGYTITADKMVIEITASPIKFENIENGVAEWYDVPLDRRGHDAVQAMLKAKKVTLTIVGSKGKKTREVTEKEIKGFRNILDGYTALGGSLEYLQINKPESAKAKQKRH
jgi:hypothetical protein